MKMDTDRDSHVSREHPGPFETIIPKTIMKSYEHIYVFFLRVNAAMVLLMGIGSSFGAIYIISQQYYLISVGEKKPFVYGVAFLLGCNFLGFIAAILSCAVTRTHGKALLTVFVGHVLAIGLVISGLIIIAKYLCKIESDTLDQKGAITGDFFATINNSNYRSNWLQIQENFNCCGIKSIEEFLQKVNYSTEEFKVIGINFGRYKPTEKVITLGSALNVIGFNVHITNGNLTDADVSQMLSNLLSTEGINLDLCNNIEDRTHRGCSRIILGVLEHSVNLLKLCCYLIFPMLIIADILCAIGYFCFNEIRINLLLSKGNKTG